jgi:hypothetical protein
VEVGRPTVEVIWPRKISAVEKVIGDRLPIAAAGRRVALINNGWGSFDDLSVVLERGLRDNYGVADVVHFLNNRHTAETSFGAPEEFLDEVAAASDVAISGLGNCGACTAWTCDASVALERRGLASVAMVTGLYRTLAEFSLAKTNRAPDHPLIVLSSDFEHTDTTTLEAAAASTLEAVFGRPETP